MPTEASSVIMFAEIRHTELQAESAQYRVARQAPGNESPIAGLATAVRHRLEMALKRVGTALPATGLTSSPQRRGTNSVWAPDRPLA